MQYMPMYDLNQLNDSECDFIRQAVRHYFAYLDPETWKSQEQQDDNEMFHDLDHSDEAGRLWIYDSTRETSVNVSKILKWLSSSPEHQGWSEPNA